MEAPISCDVVWVRTRFWYQSRIQHRCHRDGPHRKEAGELVWHHGGWSNPILNMTHQSQSAVTKKPSQNVFLRAVCCIRSSVSVEFLIGIYTGEN